MFQTTRRAFLQKSGCMLAGLAAGQSLPTKNTVIARPLLDINSLARFVDPLPIPKVVLPTGTRPSPENHASKIPYYRLSMRKLETKIHRDVKPTAVWGFGDSSPGPTLETRSGQGMLLEWANELPAQHFLPIDRSIHGADAHNA